MKQSTLTYIKNQTKIYSLIFFLFLAFPSYSYPWMFFREKNRSDTLTLDTHLSYFGKKITVFSGIDLNYHNNMADVNIGYTYSYLEKNHYPRLSELALDFPFLWENWTLSMGFKNLVWSEADRYWNYGLWQPRYLLDPFRPEQMGIPGIYLSYESQNSSITLMMSYLHLPDIIIYPEIINQELSSRNPLFIDGSGAKIEELSETFQLKKFIKPNFAVQFKNSIESLKINFSYAYKGMNQLKRAFLAQGANLSDLIEDEQTESFKFKKLDYFSNSHHLASLETELKLDQPVSLFASFLYEHPEEYKLSKDWWSSDFPSHYTFSFLAYFQEQRMEDTLFTIGWTKTTEPHSSFSTHTFTNDFRELLAKNLDWKSAISASVEHENKDLYEGVLLRLRANYALDNQFYHLILENYIYFNSYFRFFLSGDLLLRFSDRPISIGSSSIKRYQGLNRILIGGQYVF